MRIQRRPAWSIPTAMLLVALTACVQLPESGPVVESESHGSSGGEPGVFYEPKPPQPGESAVGIVRNFLEAMKATPIKTSVARKFLAQDAQSAWNPELETITFEEDSPPVGTSQVSVDLTGANRLDSRGVWSGPLSGQQSSLEFEMTVEDGEWRIAEAPNALIVPESWFAQRFRQVSLYFFDPTARLLTPEPVFVPRGEQLATTLVSGLLSGPGVGLSQVSRTFFPSSASLELSVPVSATGVAEIALQGDARDLAPEAAELMLAQLAWTLRQEPTIRAMRVTIGDEPISPPGGGIEVDLNEGAQYDPNVLAASSQLFGLREGRLVVASPGVQEELSGPLGTADYGLRDIAVDLEASRVAGVTEDGSSVLLAPVAAEEGPEGEVRVPATGGRDLLKPAWDFTGRLWLVDRGGDGAEVSVVAGDRRRSIEVPGVSGQRVKDFLVSRDGSRLVAVMDRRDGDAVVVSRVLRDDQGRVVRASRAKRIDSGVDDPLRIRDIGWTSPTSVAVVDLLTNELSEVRTLSVDGSPWSREARSSTELLREKVRRLVSSPTGAQSVYVVTRTGVVDLSSPDRTASGVDPDITALTYVG